MAQNKKISCLILGGGGHAKVVIDCMEAQGLAFPQAILDLNPKLWGKELLGVPILGGDDLVSKLRKEGVTHFISGVGGVGDNGPRKKVFEWGLSQGLIPLIVQHPSAVVSRWVKVGKGSVIFAGVVINAGAVLGEDVIVNTGAIIDHDCVIGDHVHIATGARLAGTVSVKNGAHVGSGASIRNNITIGEKSVVGVGSVVVKDVFPNTVVKGVPAK